VKLGGVCKPKQIQREINTHISQNEFSEENPFTEIIFL